MASFKAANDVMMKYWQSASALFPSGIKKTQPPTGSGKSSVTPFGQYNLVLGHIANCGGVATIATELTQGYPVDRAVTQAANLKVNEDMVESVMECSQASFFALNKAPSEEHIARGAAAQEKWLAGQIALATTQPGSSLKDKAAKAAQGLSKIAAMVKGVSSKIAVAQQSIRDAFAAISSSSKEEEEVHGDPGLVELGEIEVFVEEMSAEIGQTSKDSAELLDSDFKLYESGRKCLGLGPSGLRNKFILGMRSDEEDDFGFTGPPESMNMMLVAAENAIYNNEQFMIAVGGIKDESPFLARAHSATVSMSAEKIAEEQSQLEATLGVVPQARYFTKQLVELSSLGSQNTQFVDDAKDKFKKETPAKIAESEISPMDVLNNSCEELMDELNFYQETLDTKQHWQLVKNALQSAAELNPKLDPINKDFIDKILKTKKQADFDINAVKSFLRRHPVNTTWHQSSVEGQEGRERSNKFKRASFRVKDDREDRQRSQSRERSRSRSKPRSGPSDVANAATGKGGKGQGKGGKGQGKGCFKCGKPGHKGAKCPEQSQAANTAQASAEEPYRPSEESLAKIKMINETLNITNFAQNTQARIEIVSKASLDVKDVTWYYENEYDPSP